MKTRFDVRKLFMVGLMLAGYSTTVQGQIQDFSVVDTSSLLRFGPTSPNNGYPMWVEARDLRPGALPGDTILLELCEDTNDVTPPLIIDPELGGAFPPCPACIDPLLDLPNPNLPQSFPGNYPDEHFYWLSESIMIEADNTRSIVVLALEGAFDGLGTVVDGEQIVFTRYRIRIDNSTPGELYQITYPYGITYAEAENDQGGAAISNINFTNDVFVWKGRTLTLTSLIGSFLTAVNPPPAAGVTPGIDPATGQPVGPANLFTYLGDFCGGGPVEGSPFGTNFFSVVGPNAGMVLSSGNTLPSSFQCDPLDPQMAAAFDAYDAYVLANVDSLAAPLARIPANCTFSDEFVGLAKEATKLGVQVDRATYNRSTTAGSNSTQINVWATSFENQDIRLTIPGIPGTFPMCGDGTGNYFAHVLMPSSFIPPAEVTASNMTDNPPTVAPHALNANIVIQSAIADLGAGTLAITATIADPLQSAALSTADGSSLATGNATVGLAGGACGAVPPRSVSIASTQGGFVTAPTRVIGVVPDLLAAAGGVVVVATGAQATLDGSASVAGAGTTYSWAQTGGTDITLVDPLWDATAVSPTFTFPSHNDLLTFVLTITDPFGATSTDTAIVTNTVVAVAGADQDLAVFPDAGVALNANVTQGAGLSYSWAQVATDLIASPQCVGQTLDAAASIDLPNSATATMTMPILGGCVTLELTVTGPGGTSSDTLTIKSVVGAPSANAGVDIVVFASEMVQLDASASAGIIDAGGFAWTQVDEFGAAIPFTVALGTLGPGGLVIDTDPVTGAVIAPNISMPAFIFPATPQTLNFRVVVTGPGTVIGVDSADIVSVIVSDPGTSDTLQPGQARFDGSKDRFRVSGTSSVPGPGHFVTCWFGTPTGGELIGTSAVDPIADWGIDARGVVNPCLIDPGVAADCSAGTPTIQVHCVSTLGGSLIMDYEARD